MSGILIYNDSWKTRSLDELTRQLWAEKIKFTCISNSTNLETALRTKTFDLLLLVINEDVSVGLSGVLSKMKNLSHLRSIKFITIHSKSTAVGIQKVLSQGVKTIFVEPIDKSRVVDFIKEELSQKGEIFRKPEPYFPIGPIPCKLDVFGRIGKIFRKPLGDIGIETNLKLKENEIASITSKMALDLGSDTLTYSVDKILTDDIYYNYAYGYQLHLQNASSYSEEFAKWLRRIKRNFALPKTKILYLTDQFLGEIENAFEKKIFSVHVRASPELSLDYLRRVNPRIIVTDELQEGALAILKEWLAEKKNDNKLVVSTFYKDMVDWHHIPYDDGALFKANFIYWALPLLKARVTTSVEKNVYLDRHSVYSRCSFVFDAKIVAFSKNGVMIETPYDIARQTIFRIICPFFEEPDKSALYGKVLMKANDESKHVWTCEVVPLSDVHNQSLVELSMFYDPKIDQKRKRKTMKDLLPIKKTRTRDLFFLKRSEKAQNFILFTGAFFVATTVLSLILYLFSK